MADQDAFQLQVLGLVSDLGEKESDRFLRRFTVMLTINSGLAALATFTLEQRILAPYGTIVIAIVGFILSFMWFGLVQLSKYYEARWHKDMEFIIDHNEKLRELVCGRSDCRRRKRDPKYHLDRPKWSFLLIVQGVPILFLILWCFIIIFAIYIGPAHSSSC